MDSSLSQPKAFRRLRRAFRYLWLRVFRRRSFNYLFQCGLATVTLFVILLLQDAVLQAAIIVAVASSAFTIFVFPNSLASTPRKVVGGHVVAVIIGSMAAAILAIPSVSSAVLDSRYILSLIAALAVGIGILAMVFTDTEHPPAAGTVLGLVIHEWSWAVVGFVVISALVLSIVRIALRPRLVDLL